MGRCVGGLASRLAGQRWKPGWCVGRRVGGQASRLARPLVGALACWSERRSERWSEVGSGRPPARGGPFLVGTASRAEVGKCSGRLRASCGSGAKRVWEGPSVPSQQGWAT